jgi:small-conductance mechanosensitive channel
MSKSDHERAERFQDVYSTLLTPIALIITISAVFLVNMASFYHKESFLVSFQWLLGPSAVALVVSSFLYALARMDPEKYHRKLNQWAFGFMMFSAFLSSVLLVPELVSWLVPGGDRALIAGLFALGYVLAGLVAIIWFCRSKL